MDLLFDYIEENISNPKIFPSNDVDEYPPEFLDVVKTIFKRLFRMYGHIYCKAIKAHTRHEDH
jgi:MOB kinase activator 1